MSAFIGKNKVIPLFLAVILCWILSQSVLQAAYSAGDIAANFSCRDMNGNVVNLYDYSGYAILLNFFAWW